MLRVIFPHLLFLYVHQEIEYSSIHPGYW